MWFLIEEQSTLTEYCFWNIVFLNPLENKVVSVAFCLPYLKV